MTVRLIIKTDGRFFDGTHHFVFEHTKNQAEVIELVKTVAGAPKDDEPVMFSVGPWQVYAVPTGD